MPGTVIEHQREFIIIEALGHPEANLLDDTRSQGISNFWFDIDI
jgi:hypothetical protein